MEEAFFWWFVLNSIVEVCFIRVIMHFRTTITFFFLKTLIKWKHLPIYLLFIIIKIDVCVYVSVFLCVCVLFYVCYCPPNPGWCNSRFVWKKQTSEAGANIIIKTDFFVCVCMMFSEEKGCSQRYTIWKEDTCISEIMHIEASFGFFD